MRTVPLDLALALPPFAVGLVLTWRLIWPRWKAVGKAVAYFLAVGVLSLFIGHWSVVLAWIHQGIGMVFHIRFCRTHGFTWYAVEDPDRYVELSMRSVGYEPR